MAQTADDPGQEAAGARQGALNEQFKTGINRDARQMWEKVGLGSDWVRDLSTSIVRLSEADTKDVQQIAASQIELSAVYHRAALAQSNRSFFWALIGSGVGLLLFSIGLLFALLNDRALASIVPLVAGAVVEVVSGLGFVLYGRTSSQLSAFHSRLDVLQRYLLANSICESLDGEARNTARAELIKEISRAHPTT